VTRTVEQPSVTIADATETEGDAANPGTLTFTVTLENAVTTDTVINYTLTDVTTKAGEDYTVPANQQITVAAGQTTSTITIPLIGDDVAESTNTFKVSITTGSKDVTISDGEAIGTIIDDDALLPDGVVKDGDEGNNFLTGTRRDDILRGQGGNDWLFGRKGDDTWMAARVMTGC